jgi:hypothetical protein
MQSLADLINSVTAARSMRLVPANLELIQWLALAALLPMLPLILLIYPFASLAIKLCEEWSDSKSAIGEVVNCRPSEPLRPIWRKEALVRYQVDRGRKRSPRIINVCLLPSFIQSGLSAIGPSGCKRPFSIAAFVNLNFASLRISPVLVSG